jgi:hypothetical protein
MKPLETIKAFIHTIRNNESLGTFERECSNALGQILENAQASKTIDSPERIARISR